MTVEKKHPVPEFKKVGSPTLGTPTALAAAWDDGGGYTLFLGTPVGLYCTNVRQDGSLENWHRLPDVPVGVLCLGVSPNYQEDRTIAVGTNTGVFVSTDGGDSWRAGKMTMSQSVVLCLEFSPDFRRDGIILAGTMEDGILFSSSRGDLWEIRSFGLLDLTVLSLALSPAFCRDGTVFAGTETALYYSYNQARAWKELPFPEEAPPVLSLALSTDFGSDQTLFAGSETSGLYCSQDLGMNWQPVNLPVNCVNALVSSQDGERVYAGTEEGLFSSSDLGVTWEHLYEIPNTICLAHKDSLLLIGVVDQGSWLKNGEQDWSRLPELASRALVGMALSTRFDQDGVGFLYGPEEGAWRTKDGGINWELLRDRLLETGIYSLVVSPKFPDDQQVVVSGRSALLISHDAGDTFHVLVDSHCDQAVYSPDGKFLACSLVGNGIRVTQDGGQNWRRVPGPWDSGGKILGLCADNSGVIYIAFAERSGQGVGLWKGKPGAMENELKQVILDNPFASFWITPASAADRPCFLSITSRIWKLSGRKGTIPVEISLPEIETGREAVISLTGAQTETGMVLFACTGRRLYKSIAGKSWDLIKDFNPDRVLAISTGSSYPQDRILYTLFLGGTLYRGIA